MGELVTLEQVLNNKNFNNEYDVITINNDKPFTFTEKDYKTIEGLPRYTDSEKAGRSEVAVAIISPNTLAIYTSKNIEYPNPINWTETIEKAKIYNKSHIIGYKLSAKRADPNNIFIGTEYLNKITMKSIENAIYKDVKNKKRVYLYKVTPRYKFKEDAVPIGILIEAETIDNLEKKQLCKFCYNIQKGIKINYYDGGNKTIEKVYGKKEKVDKLKKKRKVNDEENKYREYSINIRTKTFHLLTKNCNYIRSVDPKYIQETKASRDGIKAKKFKLCKKCTKIVKKTKR